MCLKFIAIIGLTIIGFGLILVLRLVKWGEFGGADSNKLKAFMKTAISVFISLGLIISSIMTLSGVIENQLFVFILSAGLTGLGFKLGLDYNSKYIDKNEPKNDSQNPS